MRSFFYALLLLLPTALQAQKVTQYGSFKIYDGEVLYQKVFNQDSITVEKMVNFLKTVPTIGNIQASEGTVTADLLFMTIDFKMLKVAESTAMYIMQNGNFTGKLIFDMKPGKYRATLRDIKMKGDTGSKKIPEPENITAYVTVDNGTALAPAWCKPTSLGLLEQQINDRLKYKATDTDWK
jgi:hypothetical protein